MARPRLRAGGGLAAVRYVLRKGREAGGLVRLYRRLRTRNTCKTCALGMGGQQGGMVNEAGHFPEVCKKSVQAVAGDMAGPIPEAFFRATPIARLARLTSAEFERLGRLAFPLLAETGDTHFRRVPWAEALDRAGAALRAAPPDEVFFYSSGRSSNEAAFLLQLVARAFGTANIHNCSFYCHNASSVALAQVYGSGTASVTLADLGQADLALVAGANPASNHPRLIGQLVALRRRGGTVIVVNPLRELGLVRFRVPSDWRSLAFGSAVSDLYLQPHVGADVALFKALLKGVVEMGGVERAFVDAHTAGWEAVAADLAVTPWSVLVEASGVPRTEIGRAVAALVRARRGVMLWAMGLTHHAHGVDNVLALANLTLARGWLGRPGCGLLPVRGHSNVQGVGTCGMTPALKDAFAARLAEAYGIAVRPGVGHDTYASMTAAAEGRVRAAVLLGGNLFASNPDRAWAAAALHRIGATVSLTTKLNEGHVHGRGQTAIVLPVLARDEEDQATTQESMFNFVRLSEGGRPALAGEMRSEVDVITALAELVLPAGRFDWTALRSHRRLREEMARIVPGMGALAAIDETRREFHIEGRAFHEPRFATPDGRARFHVTPLPTLAPGPGEFRLTTLRSEGQFNTVVYEEEDVYRGNKRRDVVMMAAEDAARLGVEEGDPVVVETETGRVDAVAAIVDIRPGNLAMYYPEANALVPRRLDARSRTPAFKSVIARLARAAVAAGLVGALLADAPARAHDVPVAPSTCVFEPVEYGALRGAPGGAQDRFRIVWDVGGNLGQLDLRTVPPRALAGGGATGTLTLPPIFDAAVQAGGDVTTPPLPVTVTLDGGSPLTRTAVLTTGVTAGGLLEGVPLGAGGFTLVGQVGDTALRLTCQPQPMPDLDQFRLAPVTQQATGQLRLDCPTAGAPCSAEGKLRLVVGVPAGARTDFARPATLRASVAGTTVATAFFPEGLVADGGEFVGQASAQDMTVRPRRTRGGERLVLTATRLAGAPEALNLPHEGTLQVTYDVCGLLGRTTVPFRRRGAATLGIGGR